MRDVEPKLLLIHTFPVPEPSSKASKVWFGAAAVMFVLIKPVQRLMGGVR